MLCKLADIPLDEVSVLLLEGGRSRRDEHTAELVALFIKGNAVSALCKEDSGLHTADTAADDSDLLYLLCRLNVVFLRLHGLGIERAARESHGIGKILSIVMSLGGREIEASTMTADTGLDILESVIDKLGDPLGIYEELTRNAYSVDLALGNSLSAYLGRHTSRANDGDVHKFLNMRYVLEVTVLGHIHRGMRPIPRVIRTVVRVEHIIAGILKILSRSLGLLHISSLLLIFLTGNSALGKALELGLYGVTEGYGIILAARLLYSLNNLYGEAVTVLKGAAVLVCTLVEELDSELVEKIALVHRVYLYAVNARLLTELCGLGERLDDLVDMLLGHLGTNDIGRPARRLCGGRCKLVVGVKYGLKKLAENGLFMNAAYKVGDSPGASHTRGKLDKELSSGLVYLIHKFLKLDEHLLILPKPPAPEGITKGRDTGDNKTYVIVCSLEEELCRLLIEAAARQLKPAEERGATHGAHYYSVFYLYVTYLPRCKQRLVFRTHLFLLFLYNVRAAANCDLRQLSSSGCHSRDAHGMI